MRGESLNIDLADKGILSETWNDYPVVYNWMTPITSTNYVTQYYVTQPAITEDNNVLVADVNKLISIGQSYPSSAFETKDVRWEKTVTKPIDQVLVGADGTVYISSSTGFISTKADVNNGHDPSG